MNLRAGRYNIYHYFVSCHAKIPELFQKQVLNTEQSRAPTFKFQHLLFSLRSYSGCLLPLRRLLLRSIVPSVTHVTRQFLRICDQSNWLSIILLKLEMIFLS